MQVGLKSCPRNEWPCNAEIMNANHLCSTWLAPGSPASTGPSSCTMCPLAILSPTCTCGRSSFSSAAKLRALRRRMLPPYSAWERLNTSPAPREGLPGSIAVCREERAAVEMQLDEGGWSGAAGQAEGRSAAASRGCNHDDQPAAAQPSASVAQFHRALYSRSRTRACSTRSHVCAVAKCSATASPTPGWSWATSWGSSRYMERTCAAREVAKGAFSRTNVCSAHIVCVCIRHRHAVPSNMCRRVALHPRCQMR